MARGTPPETPHQAELEAIIKTVHNLVEELNSFDEAKRQMISSGFFARNAWFKNRLGELAAGSEQLRRFIKDINPARIDEVKLTLSHARGMSKFFGLQFTQEPRRKLAGLEQEVFFGSGVYAIYYIGNSIPAYAPLANTETPIYIGKADPLTPFANTTQEQGMELWKRLREHAKTIRAAATTLNPADFEYRYGTIQSGMQYAVEEFLIRFFEPIWNEQMGICYGIGKHGDAADTRRNGRSPWDTMHPGRAWADATGHDQVPKETIEANIAAHFVQRPPFPNLPKLVSQLITV